MPQQTFYVSISDFGSIAGVNPFKSREEILIKYWSKSNPKLAFEVLKNHGYITETDEEVAVAENLENVEKEFQTELDRKRPNNQIDADLIKQKYARKVKEACKKDKINEETVKKIQETMSSVVNKQCGHNTEKTILDITEKKSGTIIRKRNERMYYKTIYEDSKYKYLIGGKVDGISNADVIVEAKYRTRESNVRKNKYDLFQLLGYLFVTGKPEGKIVQKYGDKIWDSDDETEKEWGVIKLTENENWNRFLNVDLFSFFESLKEIPSDFSVLGKPFLTISQGKFYPSSGIRDVEHFLIDSFYQIFNFLPVSCRPTGRNNANYTKISCRSPSTYEKNANSSLINGSDSVAINKVLSVTDNKSVAEVNIDGANKNNAGKNNTIHEVRSADTSLSEKFNVKMPNKFKESPLKKNESNPALPSIEDDSPSLILIDETTLPFTLGGTPVKSQEDEEVGDLNDNASSPILIQIKENMTSSPKTQKTFKEDSISNDEDTKSLTEPSLESNLSEFFEAGNIAEISADFNSHLESKEVDSIEDELFSQKEDSIETVSSVTYFSSDSDISEFYEAANIAEISSDLFTTLDEESDFTIESD